MDGNSCTVRSPARQQQLQQPPGCRPRRVQSARDPPPETRSTRRKAIYHPPPAAATKRPATAPCSVAKCATSAFRRSQGMSGCRRTMPLAVHGASSRMRSYGRAIPPGCGHVPAIRHEHVRSTTDASEVFPESRPRARRPPRSPSHRGPGELGQVCRLAAGGGAGVEYTHAGAARRATRRPAARRRPAPRPSPSSNPGMLATGRGSCSHTACSPTRVAGSPSASNWSRYSLTPRRAVFTRRTSGGAVLPAARMARQCCGCATRTGRSTTAARCTAPHLPGSGARRSRPAAGGNCATAR